MKKLFTLAVGLAIGALSFGAQASDSCEGLSLSKVAYTVNLTESAVNQYHVSFSNISSIAAGTGTAWLQSQDGKKTNLTFGEYSATSNISLTESYDSFKGFRLNLTVGNLGLSTGTYTLVLPAGYLTIDGQPSEEIEIEGVKYEAPETPATSETIAPVVVVDNTLNVRWDTANGEEVIKITANNTSQDLTILNSAGATVATLDNRAVTFNATSFTVSLEDVSGLQSGGSYFLVVPDGYVVITTYGNVGYTLLNREQKLPFTNAAISSVQPVWNPAGGEIYTASAPVSVSWNSAVLSHADGAAEITANEYGMVDTNSIELIFGKNVVLNDTKTGLLIDLSTLEAGTYTIKIPAGYVSFETEGTPYLNAATEAEFTLVEGEENKGELGEGFVINPYPPTQYQSFLSAVTLAYDFKMITLTSFDKTVAVNIAGKSYDVYPDIYFDPEVAWDLGQTNSDLNWGNELVIDFSSEAYDEGYPAGTYTIQIPAGLVKDEDGQTNAAQTITFVKVNPVQPVSVTPENGMYPSVTQSTITFGETISLNPDADPIEIRVKNDWLGEARNIDKYSIGGDGKSLVLNLENMLDKGITYSIFIPQGFVKVGDLGVNKEIWIEYMEWDGMDQASLVSAPAPETSPDLNPFILTWDYQSISFCKDAPETEFVIGFPDYGMQDGFRFYIPVSDYELVHIEKESDVVEKPSSDKPANALYLDVYEYTKNDPGYQFEIFFPAGLVENSSGEKNPPLSYTFTVRNLWPDPEVKAADGIVTMTWDQADWAAYNLDGDEATLTNLETQQKSVLRYTFGGSEPGEISLVNSNVHGLKIDLTDLNLADGNYIINVPEGYLMLDGFYGDFVMNQTVTFKFGWKDGNFTEFSKVSLTTEENGECSIMDLQGRILMKGTDLRNLPAGIYIINGRKTLIK